MFWLFHTVIYFLTTWRFCSILFQTWKIRKTSLLKGFSADFFLFLSFIFVFAVSHMGKKIHQLRSWIKSEQICDWNVKWCQKTPQRNASYHNLSKPQETDSIPPKREEKLPQTQKKKTPNYQSFKTSGFKTKTALPSHELKTTTDTKPPHTQIHKKLTQNRRKESETTRLKTTKLWDLKTKNTQTKRYESKQLWRDAELPLPDSKAWERHSKPPQRDAKLPEAQNSQNSKKCLTATEP